MRFLTLTIKDDETVKSYDFTNGSGDLSPLDVMDGLEFGLFGNDALFGGEIAITAEYDDRTYVVCRDFAKGYASVTENGEPLSPEKSQLLLANLAGLGWKQWRKNTEPTDYNAFLTDFSSYVTKYLSSLGFTAEELEWRSEAYDRKNDRILAQVEVLDELVDDTLEAKAEEKMQALHALDSELLAMSPSVIESKGDPADLSELEERLAALKSEEAEYADKAAALENSRTISRLCISSFLGRNGSRL